MSTFCDSAINFFESLECDFKLPRGFSLLDPGKNAEVKKVIREFFTKYYSDSNERIFIVKDGKNINYYDDRKLIESTRNFISKTFVEQLSMGANRNVAICLGEGKNLSYLLKLNEEIKAFKRIVPLPHPRFIMQYRRKSILGYTEQYIRALSDVQK